MKNIQRKRVSELCELIVDCVNRTAPVVEYETPYKMIRTTNIRDGRVNLDSARNVTKETFETWTRRAKVLDGDVILTREAPIGEVGYINNLGQVFLGQRVMQYRPNPEIINPRFFYYAFRSKDLQHQFGSHDGSGSVVSHIRVGDCHNFEISLPDRSTQDAIVEILGSLDDKIELNRRMNETLEEIARTLFRDWFVDFGPTRRQMEGATEPTAIMGRAFTPEKATTLAPLFPAKLGHDGLPEGWDQGTAADHIDFNPKEPLKKGKVAPYSDMASLPTHGSLVAPPTLREYKSGMRFRNGDALIARITPCLENGKAGFVDYLTDEAPVGWGSTEFFVLRSKPHVAQQFAYCLVREPDFKKRAEQSMTGTSGRQRAQIEVLMSHELAVPDRKVHAEFETFTTPLFAKIKANGQENHTLADLRDLLLPKLMSGEIRLKDAEAVV